MKVLLSDNGVKRSERMARHTQKIAARIPGELVEDLDEICAREGLKNRSDALRVCIEQYVNLGKESWNSDNLILNIPNLLLEMVDRCVANGLARDRNEAVVIALSIWVDSKIALYTKGEMEKFEKILSGLNDDIRKKKLSEREQKGLVRG